MSGKVPTDVAEGPMEICSDQGVVTDKIEHNGIEIAEAVEIYGNSQVAESYRYVARGYG